MVWNTFWKSGILSGIKVFLLQVFLTEAERKFGGIVHPVITGRLPSSVEPAEKQSAPIAQAVFCLLTIRWKSDILISPGSGTPQKTEI